jgi:sec-independent protein translocase protein TatA
MPSLGGWEWVILAVVALVLFGGSKVANLGKNAGKAIREFKEETAALKSDASPAATTAPEAPAAPPVAAPAPAENPTELR